MTISRRWFWSVIGLSLVGAVLNLLAIWQILSRGADRGAQEKLTGAYNNGARAYQKQLSARLKREAQMIARMPNLRAAFAQGSPEIVRSALEDAAIAEESAFWIALSPTGAAVGLADCANPELV